MIRRAAIAAAALAVPAAGLSLTLEFPAVAVPLAERVVAQDSYFLPLAPFEEGPIEGVTAEGAMHQQSWKVGTGGLTTLQLLAPLRQQLEEAGYGILFECEEQVCGGFDFRYRIDVMPEPDMHVNLGDYRYLTAKRESDGAADFVSLVVSRSANTGFVQMTRIGAGEPVTTVSNPVELSGIRLPVTPRPTGAVGQQLEALGHAALEDLAFKTGSSELGDAEFASLAELAGYLKDRPDATVMLVGHTDAVGSLKNNIALSKRRAQSVADRLVSAYGIPGGQVGADGVGFLAPIASNLTDEGRAKNRRVEVILTSTK